MTEVTVGVMNLMGHRLWIGYSSLNVTLGDGVTVVHMASLSIDYLGDSGGVWVSLGVAGRVLRVPRRRGVVLRRVARWRPIPRRVSALGWHPVRVDSSLKTWRRRLVGLILALDDYSGLTLRLLVRVLPWLLVLLGGLLLILSWWVLPWLLVLSRLLILLVLILPWLLILRSSWLLVLRSPWLLILWSPRLLILRSSWLLILWSARLLILRSSWLLVLRSPRLLVLVVLRIRLLLLGVVRISMEHRLSINLFLDAGVRLARRVVELIWFTEDFRLRLHLRGLIDYLLLGHLLVLNLLILILGDLLILFLVYLLILLWRYLLILLWRYLVLVLRQLLVLLGGDLILFLGHLLVRILGLVL